MRRRIRTIHLKLRKKPSGKVIHIATVRSDWKSDDYNNLINRFPNTYIQSERLTIPISYVGKKRYNTDFNSLYKLHLR